MNAPTEHARSSVLQALPRLNLYGAGLAAITEEECVGVVMRELDAQRGGCLLTMNLDLLRRFVYHPAFAALVAQADLVVADGMPLIWASHLLKKPLPERITGSNLIWSMSQAAAACGHSVFMLGGSGDAAERSAERLRRAFPQLRLAGVYVPPFGFEHDARELARVRQAVTGAQPALVFVALSAPKQDWLIQQLRGQLPQAWWIGVGISFSWVAGHLPRAPQWMQQGGLEWLHRLAHEPRRLLRRYLIDDLPFAARLFGDVLVQRLRRVQETEPS
jgi:N-acetylglucosaminyldiphosphoundecaprenol N-acetyl-beta-D-mannosaminyltransferase